MLPWGEAHAAKSPESVPLEASGGGSPVPEAGVRTRAGAPCFVSWRSVCFCPSFCGVLLAFFFPMNGSFEEGLSSSAPSGSWPRINKQAHK